MSRLAKQSHELLDSLLKSCVQLNVRILRLQTHDMTGNEGCTEARLFDNCGKSKLNAHRLRLLTARQCRRRKRFYTQSDTSKDDNKC
eukprot:scaffold162056_cov18-Prasinocladus_malaysianus.AAC.1